jgi:hypothetical protein
MGSLFWVGCGWFFWVGRGGEEKAPGHVHKGRFSLSRTTRTFKQSHFLCYILYIDQWGFHCSMPSDHREGVPDPRCPGQKRVMFKFRQPDDLFHTLKTVKGMLDLVPPRTPRISWYGVLCYTPNIYRCIRTEVYRTVLYTVRGVRGLGIRMLTIDKKTSLYSEDRGLRTDGPAA